MVGLVKKAQLNREIIKDWAITFLESHKNFPFDAKGFFSVSRDTRTYFWCKMAKNRKHNGYISEEEALELIESAVILDGCYPLIQSHIPFPAYMYPIKVLGSAALSFWDRILESKYIVRPALSDYNFIKQNDNYLKVVELFANSKGFFSSNIGSLANALYFRLIIAMADEVFPIIKESLRRGDGNIKPISPEDVKAFFGEFQDYCVLCSSDYYDMLDVVYELPLGLKIVLTTTDSESDRFSFTRNIFRWRGAIKIDGEAKEYVVILLSPDDNKDIIKMTSLVYTLALMWPVFSQNLLLIQSSLISKVIKVRDFLVYVLGKVKDLILSQYVDFVRYSDVIPFYKEEGLRSFLSRIKSLEKKLYENKEVKVAF